MRQHEHSTRTLYDAEGVLLKESHEARDVEARHIACDLALRNIKEFKVDSLIFQSNQIHKKYSKISKTFVEVSLNACKKMNLKVATVCNEESTKLDTIPEYTPDQWNRVDVEASLNVVKQILSRLSIEEELSLTKTTMTTTKLHGSMKTLINKHFLHDALQNKIVHLPDTINAAKREHTLSYKRLCDIHEKCQKSLLQHVASSDDLLQTDVGVADDDDGWIVHGKKQLEDIRTLLTMDVSTFQDLQSDSLEVCSKFDELLSSVSESRTKAKNVLQTLQASFFVADTLERERREGIHILERAVNHFQSITYNLNAAVAHMNEKNHQDVNRETSNGVEDIPTFVSNKLRPSQVGELQQWSRDRIEKLNATKEGLRETVTDLNAQVEHFKLELIQIKKYLQASEASEASEATSSSEAAPAPCTTVADIDKSLSKSNTKNTTYLKQEKDRLLLLRKGIEQCIQEAEELIEETCAKTFERSEQSIAQIENLSNTIQDGIEKLLNELFYSGAVNFNNHKELKSMLMETWVDGVDIEYKVEDEPTVAFDAAADAVEVKVEDETTVDKTLKPRLTSAEEEDLMRVADAALAKKQAKAIQAAAILAKRDAAEAKAKEIRAQKETDAAADAVEVKVEDEPTVASDATADAVQDNVEDEI